MEARRRLPGSTRLSQTCPPYRATTDPGRSLIKIRGCVLERCHLVLPFVHVCPIWFLRRDSHFRGIDQLWDADHRRSKRWRRNIYESTWLENRVSEKNKKKERYIYIYIHVKKMKKKKWKIRLPVSVFFPVSRCSRVSIPGYMVTPTTPLVLEINTYVWLCVD